MNEPGKALCSLCNKDLVYGTREALTIVDHLQGRSHVQKYIINKTNYAFCPIKPVFDSYGFHPTYQEFVMPEKILPVTTNIPLCDRALHMEGWFYRLFPSRAFLFHQPKTSLNCARK